MIWRSSTPAPAGFLSTVAALALGQVLAWAALYYSFTSFVLPMQQELGWRGTTLMGAYTTGLALWGLVAYAAGAAIDRGHGRAVMTLGAWLASAGMVGWSQVSAPWMFYGAWAAMGAGMALILYEPAFAVLTHRYPGHFRQGITALTLVAGFASTLAFPAVAALQAALGWRGALLAMAGVLAGVVAPLNAWALRGPAHAVAPGPADDVAEDATLREALRTSAFWLLVLCFTCYAFAQAAFWAHVMPAFADKGLGQAEALRVLVWVGPCQVAGRVVYALFGRHWPLQRVGLLVLGGLPLSFLLFAWADGGWPLWAFAFLFGAANGLVTIVRGGLVPAYFGRSHVGRIGGAISTVGLLARAAAPLSMAALLLWQPRYAVMMSVLAGLGGVAVLALALARPPAPGAGLSRPGEG